MSMRPSVSGCCRTRRARSRCSGPSPEVPAHQPRGIMYIPRCTTRMLQSPSAMSTHPSTPSYVDLGSPPSKVDDEIDGVPFSIAFNALNYAIRVPVQIQVALENRKHQFLESLAANSPSSTATLLLSFLQHLVNADTDSETVRCLLQAFSRDFLSSTDIHSLVAALPEPLLTKKHLLRAFYAANHHAAWSPSVPRSALLGDAERGLRLVAVFGGQGASNPRCVQELQDLYTIYAPLLTPLIDVLDRELTHLCRHPDTAAFYHGRSIQLRIWLDHPDSVPDPEYIQTAAVSFPIIGAIGLAHFAITCRVLDQTPGQVRSLLHGVTGHSQGIVVAAGIARSDSWASFYENAQLVVRTLFWLGYESQQAPTAREAVSATLVEECRAHGEGIPSTMLHIGGLSKEQVVQIVDQNNRELAAHRQVYLALSNTRESFVVAGPPRALVGVHRRLRQLKADPARDQSRIPFDQRKPVVNHQFLPISAPFHTPYLQQTAQAVKKRLSDSCFQATELRSPVYHTRDGSMLEGDIDVISSVVDAVLTDPVDWSITVQFPSGTCALAFGKGVADMLARNLEGRGVGIIDSTQLTPGKAASGARPDIFAGHLSRSLVPPSWEEEFRARLIQAKTGEVRIVTKLTAVLGAPPVIVAGMTPTTVPWDFVAAIMNAGYHAELAGGGYYNAESMEQAITTLAANVPPGRGITCNLIYASPKALGWQIALLRRLAQPGPSPVEGLTIGAGIPSPAVASEYITTLGLRHITFKPGSETAIDQVLEIAKAHADFPIIIQWTGGRAGGHHSFEDFHGPILRKYGAIRACTNVILIGGGGFGEAQQVYPYLSGSWSVPHGYAPMPFDGILLGSRVMVAQEAHTSSQAKQLICAAPGVEADSQWTQSYVRPAGGVVTVQSEMGQPIHKLATRGVLFWKEMDEQIFSLPREKQLGAIQKRKKHIIQRLNADYFRPWFGKKATGEPVELEEMTYQEVLERLVDVMYLRGQARWVHPSYTRLVIDVAMRTLERLRQPPVDGVPTPETLSRDPQSFVADLRHVVPQAGSVLLHPEDKSWFLQRCRVPGQKPVNFIPVLDQDFAVWFKKDSLWQSEDVDAVPDEDADRVCILHGPVAARYAHRIDEPVKEILDGMTIPLAEMIEAEFYGETPIPWANELETASVDHHRLRNALHVVEMDPGVFTYQPLPGKKLPAADQWLEFLAHETSGWMRAIVSSQDLRRGPGRRTNWLRGCLVLTWNTVITINQSQSSLLVTCDEDGGTYPVVSMTSTDGIQILVQVYHRSPRSTTPIPLELQFLYNPEGGTLSEVQDQHDSRVQSFYHKLWLGENPPSLGTNGTYYNGQKILTADLRDEWVSVIGLSYSNQRDLSAEGNCIPIHAAMVPAWEALVAPLVTPHHEGDLLKLVHLSNSFQLEPGESSLQIGDVVEVSASVQAVVVDERGKEIQVVAQLQREGRLAMTITSAFFIRGTFTDTHECFRTTEEPEILLHKTTPVDDAILRDRPWFHVDDSDSASLIGETLSFQLHTHERWTKGSQTRRNIQTIGEVYKLGPRAGTRVRVGEVRFQSPSTPGNPVLDFLTRKGQKALVRQELAQPGWPGPISSQTVQMPASSERYSQISTDSNPIHTAPTFVQIAQLPGTIVHGMYTSAVASSVLEHLIDGCDPRRLRRWSVRFVGMVRQSDKVTVRCRHIAMIEGRMVLDIQAFRQGDDSEEEEKVLDGEAEIEQPPTAYVFTGQGSQSPNMGMDIYRSSPVARQIWDEMDEYFRDNYGFSILQIVQDNPKELTIHFGGPHGRRIRERYQAMRVDSISPDGQPISKPVLPGLTSTTRSHTFREPRGLIYSTQFAQPAITILEKAIFEDMRARGLIQEGAPFAGHSLGEYGALASIAEFMPFPSFMDVVFYRGLAMQLAMERDEAGMTEYSMVAVNPRRVGPAITESSIRRIISMIAKQSNRLLEIVNLNVSGEQYVCAGHLRNIHALTTVLNELSHLPTDPSHLPTGSDSTLLNIITQALTTAETIPKPIPLLRGIATIPLVGIDVPFHSSMLRDGVPGYRRFLQAKVREEDVQPDVLEKGYIPNVTGRRFRLERGYVKEVGELTGSEVLKKWEGKMC
ncbi:putative fatty acid synthase subunit beta [Aspergillus sclerotioniger CBS 115572]|uniref:Putative fatty acid synthase subunit beta n=1 Tax=Aspergillus sclerotioniger CBS 115572 TaxID=1450535 RepID=A0A317WND8_9EURO|nr:putative fatty acid synthase subunit beta [Aspergillus sclerotioniger CBS 115572]PWY86567.1 putative fatty acid synthase subunit beta [Aspergillus sclerotioniger CBS 115572]